MIAQHSPSGRRVTWKSCYQAQRCSLPKFIFVLYLIYNIVCLLYHFNPHTIQMLLCFCFFYSAMFNFSLIFINLHNLLSKGAIIYIHHIIVYSIFYFLGLLRQCMLNLVYMNILNSSSNINIVFYIEIFHNKQLLHVFLYYLAQIQFYQHIYIGEQSVNG